MSFRTLLNSTPTAKIEYKKIEPSRKSHFFAPKIQKRLQKGKNSLATWLLVWKSKSVNSSTHAEGNTLQSANGATYYVFTHQNAIQVPIKWNGLVDCRNNDVEIPLCVIWLLFLNKSVLNLVRVFFFKCLFQFVCLLFCFHSVSSSYKPAPGSAFDDHLSWAALHSFSQNDFTNMFKFV